MLALARFVEDDPWWERGGFTDDVSDILVGHSSVVVPVRWWEGLRYVFLRALTRGRFRVLGVNPVQGSDALDS